MATGFGAGIGRKGLTCGALSGSVMVIGMALGRKDPKDKETLNRVYAGCRTAWERFEREFGTTGCYELTGCHFDVEAERQQWLTSGGMEKCYGIVRRTAAMLCDLVEA
jgi:C_GCAxxG_C_C family probable redox protein